MISTDRSAFGGAGVMVNLNQTGAAILILASAAGS